MTRGQAALVALGAIALGVVSRKVRLGFFVWDKSLGDALYAVMVFGIVAFVRPRTGLRASAPAGAFVAAVLVSGVGRRR